MMNRIALPALAFLLVSCGDSDGIDPTVLDDRPAAADAASPEPGTEDPGTLDPETSDPETSDPETSDLGTSDPGAADPPAPDAAASDPGASGPDAATTPADESLADDPGALDPETVDGTGISEPADLFERDGYGTVDVVRMDIRTVTTPGACTADDTSGCTLADVIADTDKTDDLRPEIPVHFRASDFPDDGTGVNAEMRQRGASARLTSRKSFRVELKGEGVRWRGEDILQLNKHPHDASHIRNKLAFDLMRDIPRLPSSRTQFVELWIDDGAGPVDYGLFTHDEAATKEFLVNRGWDTDGALYKAEKFLFSLEDLEYMALDEEGKPVDKDAFESRLEIEHGKDHRKVVAMVAALADPELAFEDFLERYLDEDNLLAWVTVNFLLHQLDAGTHNFYLYNPADSERFYILPWDYDSTFAVQALPPNDFSTEALLERLAYGYARGSSSNLLKRYYRHPGTHEKVLAKAEELRDGPLSDANIDALARRYGEVVAPVAARGPDAPHSDPAESGRFAEHVARSHEALRTTYAVPMSPGLSEPRIEDDLVAFSWSPALDVTGGSVTYDLEVSSSPGFEPGARVLFEGGVPDAPERIRFTVPLERFAPGTHYVRLVARSTDDPQRFWQIPSSRTDVDGETYLGIRAFEVP